MLCMPVLQRLSYRLSSGLYNLYKSRISLQLVFAKPYNDVLLKFSLLENKILRAVV